MKKNKLFTGILLLLGICFSAISWAQNNYPIPPKTNDLMFYIQRNHNSNTIVYEANFDASGNLDKDKPLSVSWIRYDEEGQRMPLRRIERWYAYGLDAEAVKDQENTYSVKLVAYNQRKLLLKQIALNKAEIYLNIDGKQSVLDHLYIQADNSSLWPKVKYIELFGVHNNNKTYEKIINQ